MAFSYQKQVGLYNKEAIPGDRANQQETIYTPTNFTAASAVNVGGFVHRDTTNPETQCKIGGTGALLGFVERVQNAPNYNISTEGTLQIPAGGAVEIAVKGDFFAEADTSVSIGDTVYADTSTGAVTFTSTSGGAVEDTGYKAFTAATSGGMVIITNR